MKKTAYNNGYAYMPGQRSANSLQANAHGEFAGTSSIANRCLQSRRREEKNSAREPENGAKILANQVPELCSKMKKIRSLAWELGKPIFTQLVSEFRNQNLETKTANQSAPTRRNL